MAQSNPTDEQDQQSGSALVNELINSHEAFLTNHMGSSAPTYRDAGTIWIDNSANPWQVYMYDGTDDVLLFTFNTSTNTVNYEMSELTTGGGGSGDAVIRDAFNSVDLVQFNEGGPIDFLDNAAVNFLDVVTLEDTVNIEGRLNVENDLAPVALVNRTGSTNDAELEIQDGDGSKHSLVRRASANRLDITNNADTNLLEIDDNGDITIPNGSLTVSGGNLNFSTNSISGITQISFADTDSDGNTWSVQEDSSGNLEVNHGEFGSPIVVNQDGRIQSVSESNNADEVVVQSQLDSVDASTGKQVFTSDGTFTVPSSVSELIVTAVGGGGGGASGSDEEGDVSSGSDGGNTSFGNFFTVEGGNGGGSGSANSVGSGANGPHLGEDGQDGSGNSGGRGGHSLTGTGGSGGSETNNGSNGSGFGAGGGGGGSDIDVNSNGGGGGGSGARGISERRVSVNGGDSISVSVGSGGAGGNGFESAGDGGQGAPGIVIVQW